MGINEVGKIDIIPSRAKMTLKLKSKNLQVSQSPMSQFAEWMNMENKSNKPHVVHINPYNTSSI
jgi:hypothetical protein